MKSTIIKTGSPNIEQILLQRLKSLGVELNAVPGLLKDIASSIFLNPYISLLQVNKRLHFLGWGDMELDYHTYQLAIECLDSGGL